MLTTCAHVPNICTYIAKWNEIGKEGELCRMKRMAVDKTRFSDLSPSCFWLALLLLLTSLWFCSRPVSHTSPPCIAFHLVCFPFAHVFSPWCLWCTRTWLSFWAFVRCLQHIHTCIRSLAIVLHTIMFAPLCFGGHEQPITVCPSAPLCLHYRLYLGVSMW